MILGWFWKRFTDEINNNSVIPIRHNKIHVRQENNSSLLKWIKFNGSQNCLVLVQAIYVAHMAKEQQSYKPDLNP